MNNAVELEKLIVLQARSLYELCIFSKDEDKAHTIDSMFSYQFGGISNAPSQHRAALETIESLKETKPNPETTKKPVRPPTLPRVPPKKLITAIEPKNEKESPPKTVVETKIVRPVVQSTTNLVSNEPQTPKTSQKFTTTPVKTTTTVVPPTPQDGMKTPVKTTLAEPKSVSKASAVKTPIAKKDSTSKTSPNQIATGSSSASSAVKYTKPKSTVQAKATVAATPVVKPAEKQKTEKVGNTQLDIDDYDVEDDNEHYDWITVASLQEEKAVRQTGAFTPTFKSKLGSLNLQKTSPKNPEEIVEDSDEERSQVGKHKAVSKGRHKDEENSDVEDHSDDKYIQTLLKTPKLNTKGVYRSKSEITGFELTGVSNQGKKREFMIQFSSKHTNLPQSSYMALKTDGKKPHFRIKNAKLTAELPTVQWGDEAYNTAHKEVVEILAKKKTHGKKRKSADGNLNTQNVDVKKRKTQIAEKLQKDKDNSDNEEEEQEQVHDRRDRDEVSEDDEMHESETQHSIDDEEHGVENGHEEEAENGGEDDDMRETEYDAEHNNGDEQHEEEEEEVEEDTYSNTQVEPNTSRSKKVAKSKREEAPEVCDEYVEEEISPAQEVTYVDLDTSRTFVSETNIGDDEEEVDHWTNI